MWKKQWNKLKTALGTPEEYVSEEESEETVEEQPEEEEPQYNSDLRIEISKEDMAPLVETVDTLRNLKMQIGEMTLRHEQERSNAVLINSQLNERFNQQIAALRTTYNVEPTVDYALNFPSVEGEAGTFTREPDKD